MEQKHIEAMQDRRITKLNGQLEWFRKHAVELRHELDGNKNSQSKDSNRVFILQ